MIHRIISFLHIYPRHTQISLFSVTIPGDHPIIRSSAYLHDVPLHPSLVLFCLPLKGPRRQDVTTYKLILFRHVIGRSLVFTRELSSWFRDEPRSTLCKLSGIIHVALRDGQESLSYTLMERMCTLQPVAYVSVTSKLPHPPPRATPQAFDFFENYCSNSPLPGPKCR